MNSTNRAIYRLRGVIRNYEWGGYEFLSRLLSQPNPQRDPMAEYWLGSHETASAKLEDKNGEIPLNLFIANNKEEILGKTVAKKFGRLPFLLKILDVRDMLSIQVHPSKHTAELEFEKENKEKVPLQAAQRNYKDDNHKPELMVALSDFWLLHGFKSAEKLVSILRSKPELNRLLPIFETTGYDQLYKTVMEMPQQVVNDMLQPLLDRITEPYRRNELSKEQEDFWAARAALTFNHAEKIDRGIFSVYFFNLVNVKPGEGVFQDAGLPHAYLEGQNVEIMANSDNVLRGGLTPKHVDVKELMKNIRFEETIPNILCPTKKANQEQPYQTAAPDFKLSYFHLLPDGTATFNSVTGEVLLVITGSATVSSGSEELELHSGEAAFITSHQNIKLTGLADTEIYRASVPVHRSE